MQYTLAFDVYGTLIDISGVFTLLVDLMGDKAKTFMDAWRNKQLEYSFRRGLMNNYVDFSVCTKEALEFCCKTFDINLKQSQKDRLLNKYKILPVFKDVKDGLMDLKNRGHRIFAFSNGSKEAVSQLLTNAGIIALFDGVVSVESVKVFKPSPLTYEYFNKQTNSTKADSWLISSNPFDVIGAISYEMRSVWVQRSLSSVFDPWGIEPTAIVDKITQLPFILDS